MTEREFKETEAFKRLKEIISNVWDKIKKVLNKCMEVVKTVINKVLIYQEIEQKRVILQRYGYRRLSNGKIRQGNNNQLFKRYMV